MDSQRLDFGKLMLDQQNPRLPEGSSSWSQGEIFAFLAKVGVLDEIIESMLDNGYFEPEPLVVLGANGEGKHVVVEGNRRLAALLAIHEHEVADEYPLPTSPTAQQIGELQKIPCFVVDTREEVTQYLGFRHIGGLKQWSPEAKARYLILEVDRVKAEGHEIPYN